MTGELGSSVKVLFVGVYVDHRVNALEVARLQSLFSGAMPGWRVLVQVVYGAFEDNDGVPSHLDGSTAFLKGEKQIKRARVDVLTSCATVLRSIGYHVPDFLIGVGQGGLIAGLLRFPLMVEVTLQARNLQRDEIRKVVSGWANLKAIWSVNPRLWKVRPDAELLVGACPELRRNFPIDPVRGYGIVTRVPKEDEVRRVVEALSCGSCQGLGKSSAGELGSGTGERTLGT